MGLKWTEYASSKNGEQIRKSLYALGASGVMYKEEVSYLDVNQQGSKPFQPSPLPTPSKGAKACAEAMVYIPMASPVLEALVWTLQSSYQEGEKYVELWSAPTPAGATTAGVIYRNTMTYLDVNDQGSKPFQPSPAPVQQLLSKAVSQSMVVGS